MGRAHGACEARSRREEEAMRHIGDDEQRRARPQPPCALRVPAARRHLRRCRSSTMPLALPASRRLASAGAALGTRPMPLLGPAPSTTLSLSQFDFFELQHPFEIVRLRHEKVGGQHLLDDGSHAWQSQARLSASAAFVLQKAVGDSCQYDVTLPTRQGAAFEVIESDLVFEFLVLLLDGPTLMGEPY